MGDSKVVKPLLVHIRQAGATGDRSYLPPKREKNPWEFSQNRMTNVMRVSVHTIESIEFHSRPTGVLDPQSVAKAIATPVEGPGLAYTPGPGYCPAGYVKPDPPVAHKRNRVTRQPVQLSLQAAIPEDDDEGGQDQRQMPLQTEGAMTDASKRQRSPGGSMFQEHCSGWSLMNGKKLTWNSAMVMLSTRPSWILLQMLLVLDQDLFLPWETMRRQPLPSVIEEPTHTALRTSSHMLNGVALLERRIVSENLFGR